MSNKKDSAYAEISEKYSDNIASKEFTFSSKSKGYLAIKRIFDIIASFLGILICFIPFCIIAVLVKLESPGPIFYIHKRIGKNGKVLPLLKFRSMYINSDEMIKSFTPGQKKEWEENFKLDDDPRVTRIGKILRRSSMDELPQLLNIIKGDLSIVGPRPIVQAELEKYGDNQSKLLSVTPGLTGYWQAYARSNCTYEQRMQMELYYVDHANFWWDIKIIFATVGAVLKGSGAK